MYELAYMCMYICIYIYIFIYSLNSDFCHFGSSWNRVDTNVWPLVSRCKWVICEIICFPRVRLSEMAGALEPTSKEVKNTADFVGLCQWSRMAGDIADGESKIRRLLAVLGIDEAASIAEVGSVSPADFEKALGGWFYVDRAAASPIDPGRARPMHKAARIWAGI